MKYLNIQGKQRKSRYKSYKGEVGKIAPNILNRDFVAKAPFQKLTTDVTEFAVCNEKVYLSPILADQSEDSKWQSKLPHCHSLYRRNNNNKYNYS